MASRPGPENYAIQTATAPDLLQYSHTEKEAAPPEPEPARIVYQRPLFRELQQVMPIPSLRSSDAQDTKPHRPSRPRTARRAHADQQALDFTAQRTRTAEASIYCDAPVASPVHRAMAAALDASMVVMALGTFVITFELAGGVVTMNAHTAAMLAGIAAVFGLLYQLLFCLANGDTPGMRWTQLRLTNFDGGRPDAEQRVYRLAGQCLSVLAAGLGLLWALVDEEKLTWHDHMSRTFPSPRSPGTVE